MTSAERRDRFDQIFREHFRDLLAYSLRRVGEPADAADVVAETYLTAWRRLDRVPDGPDARLWLFGAARRVISNHRRGRMRRDALAERLRSHLADLPPAGEPDDGTAEAVRAAMAALKADDREVLALVCWEGLDPSEAARVLGIPAATARTRLHRARRRMRDELACRGIAATDTPRAMTALESAR